MKIEKFEDIQAWQKGKASKVVASSQSDSHK